MIDKMTDGKFMELAIEKAREGVRGGQSPFGACIVKNGEVLSCVHNAVWENMDITAHAEICAIRQACKKLDSIDLSGCIIYSTCEPCPMCFSACHWARISRIVYGTRIKDAQKFGFNELSISNRKMKEMSVSSVEIIGDFFREENIELFKAWFKRQDKRAY